MNVARNNTIRRIRSRKDIALGVIIFVTLVLLGKWFYGELDSRWKEMLQSNLAHSTTGTVRSKGKFTISKEEPYYINDLGDKISKAPGTEQWRVYYQIDNFDQVPEPKRTELENLEIKREQRYGMRFRNFYVESMEEYDRMEIGDKLEIVYRYIGDKKDIISIKNLTHPRKH
jgi:hypothetical protein